MTLDERAQKARQKLFARYDMLNDLWLEAEEQINRQHIPREVYYLLPKEEDDHSEAEVFLGLQKDSGKWQIVYAAFPPYEFEETWFKHIIECSAEIRVETAKHLPGLFNEVIESAEKFIPEVDLAIKQLSEVLEVPGGIAGSLADRDRRNGKPKE